MVRKLGSSVDSLSEEFEREWEPQMSGYSRKLIEFCSSKALMVMCGVIDDTITDGSFSRFTFDICLLGRHQAQKRKNHTECIAKESEEKKVAIGTDEQQDDVSLFYSDLMPLLVSGNGFFRLEQEENQCQNVLILKETLLVAPTGNRLHFPAYDKFLKEIDRCIKHLQKQDTPTGIELEDDEFILHVEGTASSQRVVRHIGGTSWPGRLTLTNYALYFEASGVISYENALKLDLSKDVGQNVKPVATGPWGAPLFDKAIVYESSELQEGVVLEFPEMTSSTRRDHWLALVKEVMLLHQFLSKFKVESALEVWEMHARTILGIIRLHAAREMLRISPPVPESFLIFALLDELPKGDYVLQELAESLKKSNSGHPCSASSILRSLNVSRPCVPCVEPQQTSDSTEIIHPENLSSLESAINQAREEAKETDLAKSTAGALKEEGISQSAQVLIGLLKPLQILVSSSQEIVMWERPMTTSMVVITTLIVIYKELIGLAISAFLLWAVAKMLRARRERIPEKQDKIVICTASDQSTMESIVSAQQGLRSVHEIMQQTNIALLKIWSILISKAPKHTNTVMIVMAACAIVLAVIPIKFILMAFLVYGFSMTSKLGKCMQSDQGNRRLKEWWDSIPIVPLEIVD
ncbi:hypothetical protein Sango_2900700 [Sesamum angolense]|uniref:Uncharacterized protein n=1 Tax=Sesamum angolense TaxID=2727404 RepID=A0AAE1T6J0_9LAMI|nr:hypothetical protein Sango_2900700 [Sesamum angolense]